MMDAVLDLGAYTSFSFEKCLRDKRQTMVLDEGGLYSPLSISLIIPTRFGSEEGREIEREALRKILSECSGLVDAGYLDEILVVDATGYKGGVPDFRVLQNVVRVAYEEIGLFRDQVNLLNKYGSENERGKRGIIDFFIKVVHQLDDNIPKVLAKFRVFGVTGFFGVPYGKGAGLWLSVPFTKGDILCFIDADVLNFKKEFVAALCHPIVYSWNLREAAIKFVKAYFTRLTKTSRLAQGEAILGGRVSRLFATPLIHSVTESLGFYAPLRTIKYPLAGEFALSRDIVESLTLPTSYSVEVYSLYQLLDLIGSALMAQVDLRYYHHIGQELSKLEDLAREVGTCIIEGVVEKRKRPVTNEEAKQILTTYEKYAKQTIKESEDVISKIGETGDSEVPEKLLYSKEEDEQRFRHFLKIVKEILNEKRRHEEVVLPSWSHIMDKTGNYFILREMLRRRSNQSTWSRLRECNIIS